MTEPSARAPFDAASSAPRCAEGRCERSLCLALLPDGGACAGCAPAFRLAAGLGVAFQPIIRLSEHGAEIVAQEALLRGPSGEPAGQMFGELEALSTPHIIDQACRFAALREAARLGLQRSAALLSINVLPNAGISAGTCIATTVDVAQELGFAPSQLLFELTEVEQVRDMRRLREVVAAERARGSLVALDDFGAGHSGLALLAELQPDFVKIDMSLVRGVDTDRVRRTILRATVQCCEELGITAVAEGVETAGELAALGDIGLDHVQGYLLARPGFGMLPEVSGTAEPLIEAAMPSRPRRQREPAGDRLGFGEWLWKPLGSA